MNKKTNEEKACWSCKRSYMRNEGKLGLCPKCVNIYGSYAVSLCALGLTYGGKQLIKHSGKIMKTVAEVAKNIKS